LLGVLALGACGGTASTEPGPPGQTSAATEAAPEEATLARGGTLRVGLVEWAQHEQDLSTSDGAVRYAFDPQVEYYSTAFELFRCCLLRTLLSYNGRPADEGGAELRPDLAAGMPEVSSDGLTWTFRLKPGLHYAPPFEDTPIVATDFVRALERTLSTPDASAESFGGDEQLPLGNYADYYSPLIEGAQAFADGQTTSISGLETPDDSTLVVYLTEPAGDLGFRLSLPAAAPIPPGAAEGHDDGYGPFLVASGPYMIEGSEQLDFSRPPADQEPVSGYLPGTSLTFVRNPSWHRASDGLREAYADRIELAIGLDADAAYTMVERGELDLVLDSSPPAELAARFERDPELEDRLLQYPVDMVRYAALVLAAPPFDDVHVRKAVNLVVDKARLVELSGGPLAARVASHIAPDSIEANLLLDYDPYSTPGDRGDVEAARAEIAKSSYDRDGDGVCNDEACTEVTTLALVDRPRDSRLASAFEEDLAKIGITLATEELPLGELFTELATGRTGAALAFNLRWGKDFPSASGWFPPLFASMLDPAANPSLVGVSPDRLEEWGYPVTSVPGVDPELADCQAVLGGAQTECWAGLDQKLMETVVPWVPLVQHAETRIVSERVAAVSVDQFVNRVALDRVALQQGGS
jgi:peptide/nickel transport system substrate-binding protein